MAHILVFFDEPHTKALLVDICELEGHDVVTVNAVEEALMILRATLHPLIAILERDHSSRHPLYPLFPTIRQHPEDYGHHRYITVHWWELSDEEQTLLRELDVEVIRGPVRAEQLLDAIVYAEASLKP